MNKYQERRTKMKLEELNRILELHKKWLNNEDGGIFADLSGANLSGANLIGVKYNEDTSMFLPQCPEGSFIAWKKSFDGLLIKLLITEDAKRSSATSLKCRANKALVLDIEDLDGNKFEQAISKYDSKFIYKVGEVVEVKDFDEDRWNECSSGIHFFISKEMARIY